MNSSLSSEQVKRIRLVWWAVFPLLVLADVSVQLLHLPISTEALISYILTYFIPMYLTVGSATLLVFRVRGVERRFWGMIAVAVALLLIPESYWVWYETAIDFRGPRIPNWVELGHLGAILALYALIISMTKFGEAPLVTRARFYLDVIGGGLVAWAAVYWWWTLPLFRDLPMGGWPVAVVAAIYPVSGSLVLLTTILIVLGWKVYKWRPWERLVSVQFAMYGLGLTAFPMMYSDWLTAPVQRGFDWYTVVWGFGHYMFFMATVYRATSDNESVRAKQWSIPILSAVWLPTVYPALLALAWFSLGLASMQVADAEGGFVLVIAAALVALLLIARSWLSSVELSLLRERSITDLVTGAFNQRHLYDQLPRDLDDTISEGQYLSVIAFDVADFRDIVGMTGEREGDRVLAELTDILQEEAPSGASAYRVGRDEFVLVVRDCSAAEAAALAHRVCARASRGITAENMPISLSAGVAVCPDDASDAPTLVSRALACQQLARAAENTDVVVYDADVVDAADPLVRLERARLSSHRAKLRALASAADARDQHTRHRSDTVAEIVRAFALILELPAEQTRVLETAAHVYNVGFVGIPDEILLKPGRLTAAEREIVEQHTVLAERLLAPAGMPEILPAVRHHHERWDGAGYPDHLVGPDIPFEACVLSVCDAFEAMTNSRSYREAMTTAQALAELDRCAGTQFDPYLVVEFSRMVVRMQDRGISDPLPDGRRLVHLGQPEGR
jgi:diguanylate cyclase (GGDEF)-like protein